MAERAPAGGAADGPAVAVVGSANIDLIATVEAAPAAGETVLATGYAEEIGGKGLNQAVAAASSVPTALVAAVGDDPEGERVRAHARARGVDVREVGGVSARTGRALITLFDQDNVIVVAPLANAGLTAPAVDAALRRLRPAVVLTQFEISEAAVRAAALWCRRSGARLLINPSPVRRVADEVLALADPLVVNLGEAAALAGVGPGEAAGADPAALAGRLAPRVRSVVVTAGPGGAWVGDGGPARHLPVPERVEVVDSSGAGDAFAGRLAAALAVGDGLDAAVRSAVAAATRLVATPRERR
ncbi:PfkB family carbohydrate kinase [Streptomyces sp. DSM 44915]|uniref:PfkB family carbohydrate kinase n=1 Tax=Streptomyces chisholmiae TaxID=3075540 RepID=A0ABU2JL91_9ACTN|nr:PfkB family carbohydrate kinase [Streptomyces sp. DSM 44915]MDT0265752.1 PfkB family carbohydrate kinase [Streptomyces sp. DSM 44915]